MWRCRRFLAVAGLVLAFLWATPVAKADVQIASLNDLNLGTWSGIGDLTGDISHCVLNTVNPRRYNITASGDGAGGAFALINGASSLPFQVSYNDGGGFTTMTATAPLTNQGGYNPGQFNQCMNGTRAAFLIRVLILGTDMSVADGGPYTGTIYLTVVPE